MKSHNVNISLYEVKGAYVTIDLGSDIERYKSMWLALSNHKRENENILDARNQSGTNLVTVVLDIDGANKDEAESFCNQFGKVVSYNEQIVLVQECDEIYLNGLGDCEIFISK